MNGWEYFLTLENWSIAWLLGLVGVGMAYSRYLKTNRAQRIRFFMALLLAYMVFGSPLAQLSDFALHTVSMIRQMLVVMVLPILVWGGLPKTIFDTGFLKTKRVKTSVLLPWFIGALAMWGGHLLNAALLSSKTGLAFCGISVGKENWLSLIPENMVLLVVLVMGLFFALPVFHPNASKRIAPLKAVVYLFTSCVSCSILGLDVAFSASSAALETAHPLVTTLRNPFAMTMRADQEMAGMLMWVPGCILYVALCMKILLEWYGNAASEEDNNEVVSHPLDGSAIIHSKTKSAHI